MLLMLVYALSTIETMPERFVVGFGVNGGDKT